MMTSPRFSERRRVYIGAMGDVATDLGPQSGDVIWRCTQCQGKDFVSAPTHQQLQYFEIMHCAKCRPHHQTPHTRVQNGPCPPMQQLGIKRSTLKDWAIDLILFAGFVLFMLALIRAWLS